MISTGAKSVSESIEQLQKTMNLLVNVKLVRPLKLIPKIQNIVGTLDVENRIDLKSLCRYYLVLYTSLISFLGQYLELHMVQSV